MWQLQHAKACFQQELQDTEPLVAQLREVINRQRSLLSAQDSLTGELHKSLLFLVRFLL